jgi:hypothetical protein
MAESIDDRIADIEELDQLRQRTRTIRQQAIEALTAHLYRPQPRSQNSPEWTAWKAEPRREGWQAPGDDIEKAMMLQALSKLNANEPSGKVLQKRICDSIREDLLATTVKDCQKTKNANSGESLDNVPIMRCAFVLQALIQTGHAFSRAAFACFYCIALELNEVVAPTWSTGSARASDNALASAFTTGECAKALRALETAMLRTADAAGLIDKERARIENLRSDLSVWLAQEEAFRAMAIHVSLTEYVPHFVLKLSDGLIDRIRKLGENRTWPAGDHQSLVKDLEAELANALEGIPSVTDILDGASDRSSASKASSVAQIVAKKMGETAQNVARDVLTQLIERLKMKGPGTPSARAASNLREAARMVHELLEPIGPFAESIVDRELAHPQLDLTVDAAELVFAACLLGHLSGWRQPKVRSAFNLARQLLSADGRLSSLQPFNILGEGYRLNVATFEVTRRLAELASHVGVELEPTFVKTLVRPFAYTRAPGQDDNRRGWMTDPHGGDAKSEWWVTALAVDALGTVIAMLNAEINRQVLQQFHVRRPIEIDLDLTDLFYPDYGLAAVRSGQAGRDRNVAEKLQELRHHAGRGPMSENSRYSLILYGPPGTGKTTLVEAIAKSADVPLVEITPSDILVGGEEAIERRTRHVFLALSMLTNVVILFDEFDPILQDRAKRRSDELPKSIFEFLTPGMLPKLKRLHDCAKNNRVSYVLATNFVYNLDPAIIRQGRFDDHHGVYPPDAVSRLGRLLDQLKRQVDPKLTLDKDAKLRLLRVIDKTRGGAMDQIAKPGWYSAKNFPSGFPSKSAFSYIETANRAIADVRREATFEQQWLVFVRQRQLPGVKTKIHEHMSDQEKLYWDDWSAIDDWDKELGRRINKPGATLKSTSTLLAEWVSKRRARDARPPP